MVIYGNIHIRLTAQNISIIDSPYIIYHEKYPIGFLEISNIFSHHKQKNVSISYALHKNARRKGYMKTTLRETSNLLLETLEDIDGVILSIDPSNIHSKKVAKKAGLIENKEWSLEYHSDGKYNLSKEKKMNPIWIYFFCKVSVNIEKNFFSVFTNKHILVNI